VRYKGFRYQAASWSKSRRVVAKVEHHQGELFPRVGFIIMSMALSSRSVVRFYNKRGTAEQWIKEPKQATNWTRLSCHRFRANEVRLQLSVLAYNLGNLWRRLGLPQRIKSWSLTSLQCDLPPQGVPLSKLGSGPHHGSAHLSTRFVQFADAERVLISAANENRSHHHPRETALNIYEEHGAIEFLSTSAPDADGLDHLTVTIGPTKDEITTSGPTTGFSFWSDADPSDTCPNGQHNDFCLEFKE